MFVYIRIPPKFKYGTYIGIQTGNLFILWASKMGVVHLIIVYVPGVGLVVSKARGVKFAVSFF